MAGVSKRPGGIPKPSAAVATNTLMVPTGPPCKGRSVKKLQGFMRYIGNDTSKINILLARALLNDDLLDVFDGYPHANECAFSYPDSDWYSVYLLDEDGNKVWDPEAGHIKLYFKIIVDGSDAHIDESTMTNDTPPDLIDPYTGKEILNCVVSGSSCTGSRTKAPKSSGGPSSSTRPVGRPPATARAVGRPSVNIMPSPIVPPDILSGLENLTIGPGPAVHKPSERITRDYFEEMKSKDVIVDWMIKNMSRSDLIKCIEKGAVSASDISEARSLVGDYSSEEEEVLVKAAKSMPESEFKKMLKKATKESIKDTLSKISDPVAKKNAIVDLCTRAGIPGYSVRANKKGIFKIYDPDEDQIDEGDINELLDTCASNESIRLKSVIDSLRKRYARSGIIYEARKRSKLPPATAAAEAVTLESIIAKIIAIGSLVDKKNAIAELCARSGNTKKYNAKLNKKGVLKIYEDTDLVDDADIDVVLKECAADEFERLKSIVQEEPIEQTPLPPAAAAAEAVTLQSIIAKIMAIGSLDDKKNAIAELCERSGNTKKYNAKLNKKGVLKIYEDTDLVDDADIDDVLKECAADEFARLNGFGKSRSVRSKNINKFKMAAKKCKGKPNYRKCMSKNLKKKNL
jgi:hypothetical protein